MYLGEADIEPKRLAVMFKPAKLALEYHVKSLQCDLLLEIDLDDKLKTHQSARKITETLYKTYSDVLIKSKVPEDQVIKLINKIIAKSLDRDVPVSDSPKTVNNLNIINSMERYPGHSPDKPVSEERFSKSNQNFFSTNRNSNINFIDQTFQEDRDLKAELNQINQNRKSGYLDEEKEEIQTPTSSDLQEGLSHSSGRGSKKNYSKYYDLKL